MSRTSGLSIRWLRVRVPSTSLDLKVTAEASSAYRPTVGRAALNPSTLRKSSAEGVCSMPGRSRSVPSYRRHKQSGQAIVTLTDGLGGRRDVLLGKHGSKESRVEYARIIAEWEANGRRTSVDHG